MGLKLLMRLRIAFSDFREQKFERSFSLTLNLLCSCSIGTAFLRFPYSIQYILGRAMLHLCLASYFFCKRTV